MNTELFRDKEFLKLIKELFNFNEIRFGKKLGGLSSFNIEIFTDNSTYVLKQFHSKKYQEIRNIEVIQSKLNEHNLPIAKVIQSKNKKLHFQYKRNVFCLMKKVEGKILHEDTLDYVSLRNAGIQLAKFHKAVSEITEANFKRRYESSLTEYKSKIASTKDFIRKNSLSKSTDKLVNDLIDKKYDLFKIVPSFSEAGKEQLIHGDFHNENILFKEDESVAAIVDFEEVCFGNITDDLFHFINLACCNTGYEKDNLEKSAIFLKAYSSQEVLNVNDIKYGFYNYLKRISSSFFLESAVHRNKNLFILELLERDLGKTNYLIDNHDKILKKIIKS